MSETALQRAERQVQATRDRVLRLELVLETLLRHAKASGVDLPFVEIDTIRYSSGKKNEAKSRALSMVLGHAANERGAWAERQTIASIEDIIEHGPRIAGCKFKSVRAATKAEDRAGVDVVVETSIGTMTIQVKSSKLAANGVRSDRGPDVVFPLVVVVSPSQTHVQIRKHIAGQLTFGAAHPRRAWDERERKEAANG